MPDPLDDLPKLPTSAMSPCICCGRQLLESGLPIFYRLSARQCGIDARAVDERVGLAVMMGGRSRAADVMPLADVMAGRSPVVVMNSTGEFNVCHSCASKYDVQTAAMLAVEKGGPDAG
ncbi:MAG TPA: hypothetical protein VGA98_07520 [Allosphingosinicella sp.]|jgi:hypothetical protein